MNKGMVKIQLRTMTLCMAALCAGLLTDMVNAQTTMPSDAQDGAQTGPENEDSGDLPLVLSLEMSSSPIKAADEITSPFESSTSLQLAQQTETNVPVPIAAAEEEVTPLEAPALAPEAEPQLTDIYPPEKGALELVGATGHMTNGYGPSNGSALRGMLVTDQGVVQGSIEQLSRFGYTGKYGTASLTRDISPDYYMTVGAGLGSSELFSRWRVDVNGYRKFGPDQRFVAGLGTYYAKGQDDGRSDQGVSLNGIAYFNNLVLEAGWRFNQANPGLIAGPSQYVAATVGNDNTQALVLSAIHTREAYQVLSTGTELANYESYTVTAQWRQRITPSWMLLIGGTYYENPYYIRTIAEAGLRWSFR
jgi:YaiO family outer membrane protein